MKFRLILLLNVVHIIVAHSPFKNTNVKLPPIPSTAPGQFQFTSTTNSPPLSERFGAIQKPNPFDVIYQWSILDFAYPTLRERERALATGKFIPENNLPLGIGIWRDRLFVTMPRWKNGVPASLASLPLPAEELSPPMQPYPNWAAHSDPERPDCELLMSVYRLAIDDQCNRLWVLDAGIVNATISINPICPPKIMVYDLETDQLIIRYELPADQVKEDSLHSNIVVDVRDGQCNDAYAYVTDVWRFGLVVFSLAKGRSWRTTNHLYLPNPVASDYTLHGLNFQWTDGVFGISLTPVNQYADRLMFFHPMSSYAEFMVSTSVLRNETLWENGGLPGAFVQIGDRGMRGQSSTSGIDRSNVMFFNLVHQDAVGCWDLSQPYRPENLGIVAVDNETLIFPNDMKVDDDENQGLWVLSNRLPIYLYAQLNYDDINFRIQRVGVADAVRGTNCDTGAATGQQRFLG